MPLNDPDPTDPNMLVGVMLPAAAEAMREMAYVFAEEFARLGYTREQLFGLFKNPFYGGAHGAYRALGEQETLTIIDECLNVWAKFKITVQDVQVPSETVADVMLSASEASQIQSEILRLAPQDDSITDLGAGEKDSEVQRKRNLRDGLNALNADEKRERREEREEDG
jgi:hypothetical protein